MPGAVALVPARAGSVRVPGKNVRALAGHPLIAYSIAAARESGLFDAVLVSTDSEEIAAVARRYGAEVPGLRPAEMAGSGSSDIEWVRHVLDGTAYELFSILRPTSPFRRGATILCGGERDDRPGFHLQPTLIENSDELSRTELFGPITVLHRVRDFDEAIELANASPYGLTAACWTASVHRGQEFVSRIKAGMASVNGPTFGSEPHWPFGGVKDSGTGWREPGTEALDVYSDVKVVQATHDPSRV